MTAALSGSSTSGADRDAVTAIMRGTIYIPALLLEFVSYPISLVLAVVIVGMVLSFSGVFHKLKAKLNTKSTDLIKKSPPSGGLFSCLIRKI